jgi:hypothetical protein
MAGRPSRRRAACCMRVSLTRFPARSNVLPGPQRADWRAGWAGSGRPWVLSCGGEEGWRGDAAAREREDTRESDEWLEWTLEAAVTARHATASRSRATRGGAATATWPRRTGESLHCSLARCKRGLRGHRRGAWHVEGITEAVTSQSRSSHVAVT